ncbi:MULTISPECIES: amidase [Alphaproteobacteria]|uniref:Amidase n=2 Tax=Alphaproteobacteria TaxID=28211 RepID=A0A512HFV0_9HYPH|nr:MULTISPECIES: amidase [Alphaproteobacteria]GEO84260.1 amidase [Ciceribacter naphthalenivorans]GLR24796.1 amidase [Ciceribacter naphthalenivorans]GLT07652.1 amidase [Sphingomonas psychrolutea]
MIKEDATYQLAALRAGTISPRELMEETLDRIADVNPGINAIVALREREILLEEAERARPGLLQGLPMAIKDLAETAGIVTSYGSPVFKDNVPAKDSPMVARLRKAGAVIIGKTNTPEFGLGSHSYNPVYGVTRNPFDQTRSAGGSSGGAGAALASRMVALADGSDMMGSLRNPAGWNNVFGFRPSYGLVASGGPGDMFLSQLSTDGPMARSMRDLELLLGIQSEYDPSHPHSSGPYRPGAPTAKLTIGWLGDWGGAYRMEPGVLDLCENAVQVLEGLGHSVKVMAPPFPAEALWEAWTLLRSWSIAGDLGSLLQQPHDLLKPELRWEIERGLAATAEAVQKASEIRSDWFRCRAEMEVDILALPSAQMFPFDARLSWPDAIGGTTMDTYHRWMEVVVPASLIGLPALCVPAGFGDAGTPMGLQLIGRRGRDADVLALGREYESATNWIAQEPAFG